jgi:hypothetical protein
MSMTSPLMRVALIVLMTGGVAGCVRRDGLNADCHWPREAVSPLDLSNAYQQRHLAGDAQLAEELGIRHGDAYRGRESVEERGRRATGCTRELVAIITHIHGVCVDDVERARLHRELRVDLVAVALPMTCAFCFGAYALGAPLRRRFGAHERGALLIATTFASLVASAAGVMIGELWSWIVEMIRVDDSHLSYRALRLPWTHHRFEIFAIGLALFWLMTWLRIRGGIQRDA